MAARETLNESPFHAGLPEAYLRWRRSWLGRITDRLEQRLLSDLMGAVDGMDVLDVGCGDGALASMLAQRGARVTGIDADPRMIAAARSRAEAASVAIDLALGRAEALPFPDRAFDRVVAVTVLCFVHSPVHAIAEMARVLKPGGRLVVGELGRWSLWSAIRRIRGWLGSSGWAAAQFHTIGELRDLLERHGLVVRKTCGSIYYPPWGIAAMLMAPVDPWLGRRTTLGASFIALSATKPI